MEKKLNLCIDIDGTLTDPYFFIPYLNEITGKELTIDDYISNDWNIIYGTEHSEIYAKFDHLYADVYLEAEMRKDAQDVLYKLIEKYNVWYVSARGMCVNEVTQKWFVNNKLDYSKAYLLGNNHEKIQIANKLKCDYFIEDDPKNAKIISQAGFKVILLDNNYNKKVDGDKIYRVNNWAEAVQIIENRL